MFKNWGITEIFIIFYPKSVIRKSFLSFLMTAIRKIALYMLDS